MQRFTTCFKIVAEYVSSAALQVGEVTVTGGIVNIKCNANPSIHFFPYI